MSELGKKLNFPRTSEAGDDINQRYALKLTRVLDDMRKSLMDYINNLTLGVTDHGELTGLQDVEDHLYAFLHDGSRPFTAYGPGFTNDTALSDNDPFKAVSEYAIKAYVDALLAYILASPVGTVIYVWKDAQGTHYLERLTPGQYGQVLTTAGANHPPFWAWVYEEPGADFGGRIWFTIWMYAYVRDVSIITIDVEKTVSTAGAMTLTERDNFNEPLRFTNSTSYGNSYHPAMDAAVQDASIITMDAAKQVTAFMKILFPLSIQAYDTVTVLDSVTVVLSPLKIDVNDSVSVTDSAEVAVL